MSLWDSYIDKAKKKASKTNKSKGNNTEGGDKDKKHNPHEGHRQRMKKRFLNDPDLRTFAPHEALELFLFNAVPRKDTNNLAHRLIEEFGSFENVFDASFEDLLAVKDMTENAAMMIKQAIPVVGVYSRNFSKQRIKLNSAHRIINYYRSIFENKRYEEVYAVLLDIHDKLITSVCIGSGNASSTLLDTAKLSSAVRAKGASRVVLLHNHPGGNLMPSATDLSTTCGIMIELANSGNEVIDHIIFGPDGKYFSFYENNLIKLLVARCNEFLRIDIDDFIREKPVPRSVYDESRRVVLDDDISDELAHKLAGEWKDAEDFEEIAARLADEDDCVFGRYDTETALYEDSYDDE